MKEETPNSSPKEAKSGSSDTNGMRWLKPTLITLGVVLGISVTAHVVTWVYFDHGDHRRGVTGHYGDDWDHGDFKRHRGRYFSNIIGLQDKSGLELISIGREMLNFADQDGDGEITREDGDSLFQVIDRDGNDEIDRSEQNVFLERFDIELNESFLHRFDTISRTEWSLGWAFLDNRWGQR